MLDYNGTVSALVNHLSRLLPWFKFYFMTNNKDVKNLDFKFYLLRFEMIV